MERNLLTMLFRTSGKRIGTGCRCDRLILVFILLLPFPAVGQINDPAYADYFLVGRFGEICTMCEAIVLCEAASSSRPYESIPERGSFTVYHFETRTFWSQIATIWEWFITNFDSDSLAAAGHARPVNVYAITNGQWSKAQVLDARVSLDPATIVIDEQTIDRVERRWLRGTPAQAVGYCQRLPLWESLDIISGHQAGDAS